MNTNYILRKNIEVISARANVFHNIYGIKNLEEFLFISLVSQYKNSDVINNIGKTLENKYNIKWLVSDFKKRDGYKKSIELSYKYDLYRQHYCGCLYSKEDE